MKTLKDCYDWTDFGDNDIGDIKFLDEEQMKDAAREWVKYAGNIDFPKTFGHKTISEHCDPFVAIEIALKHIFDLNETD